MTRTILSKAENRPSPGTSKTLRGHTALSNLASAVVISVGLVGAMVPTLSSASPIDPEPQTCEPRLITAPTTFPSDSLGMRTSGTVLLEVMVAANGDVTAAKVHRSSKLRRLDRAAVRSALSEWHFDTSGCGVTNRPSVSKVAVVYEAKAAETSVPMRVPGFSRQLVQSKRMGCDVSGAAEGDFVTSCVVATGANAPLIAGR